MIKIKKRIEGTPVTVTMELLGQPFEIELLPFPEKEWLKELDPFRKRKSILNPMTNRMEMITYFEEDNQKYLTVTDNLLDRIVVNFHGIADESGAEMNGTLRENKLLLGSVKVEDFEEISIQDEEGSKGFIKRPRTRMFRNLIFEKAQELASTVAELETKN